jgi:hypothetical protein
LCNLLPKIEFMYSLGILVSVLFIPTNNWNLFIFDYEKYVPDFNFLRSILHFHLFLRCTHKHVVIYCLWDKLAARCRVIWKLWSGGDVYRLMSGYDLDSKWA